MTSSTETLERRQERMRLNQRMLDAGVDEKGKPLTADGRRDLQRSLQVLAVKPVIRYAGLWQEFIHIPTENGLIVLVASAVALLGLFNGEAQARMEAILLTAKARRRVVTAKLLAAAGIVGGIVALFFGLHFAALACVWGLDGAAIPVSEFRLGDAMMPIAAFYLLWVSVVILGAMACAAIVAWASARFRQVLAALLVAGGLLGGMVVLLDVGTKTLNRLHVWYPQGEPFYDVIGRFLHALPTSTLTDTLDMAWRAAGTDTLALLLLLPVFLIAPLCGLCYRAFLRRRRT